MGRKPKYEDITDKWMHDPKWRNQVPFMIGDFLCYEIVKGSGRDATYAHFMYNTKDKTFNNMICDGVPVDVIKYYINWFLDNDSITYSLTDSLWFKENVSNEFIKEEI